MRDRDGSASKPTDGVITRVEALGYRSLRYVSQRLGPFHVLVGANASGKSTFLDVIAFLGDIVRAGVEVAVQGDPGHRVALRAPDAKQLTWMRQGARFELAIHERVERGEALTADGMVGLMADLFAEGYGDEVVVDRARVGSTWMQFSTHFYANFYVYQYATGISGAHALARRVLAGEQGAVEAYLGFLKAGGSRFPLDTLRLAGVENSVILKPYGIKGWVAAGLPTAGDRTLDEATALARLERCLRGEEPGCGPLANQEDA